MFKPGYIRLCRVAHEYGLKVFMHSCGKITAIIPDLIDAGIDVLQFDQPRLHGIDTLARFHGQDQFLVPGGYPDNATEPEMRQRSKPMPETWCRRWAARTAGLSPATMATIHRLASTHIGRMWLVERLSSTGSFRATAGSHGRET